MIDRLCSALLLMSLPAAAAEEDLNAPPLVTAKAWAIAEGGSGKLLWGGHAEVRSKSASTTKMMCAFTVLKLAESDPAVLAETITYSKLAGSTAGSTSEVKTGESLSVRDALYALLLPSGNDAGNALAEHFNNRYAPPDAALLKLGLSNPALASRVSFIAEMNRHARAIGMTDTVYRASFGDGGKAEDRTTTARDLCLLAATAMKNPVFREMVATQQHEGSITKTDGSTRKQKWENTNPLLKLDLGYDGIKTGMTNQAGHCLVASGHRGSDHLIVAVLGCVDEAARSADIRNLFRWAWRMRGK